MKPVKCTNGHIYNADRFSTCPYCSHFQTVDFDEVPERAPLLGIPPVYPENGSTTKEKIERLNTRIDGKKICNYLRQLRNELAKANGIKFFSEECPSFVGPCAGTCAKCDLEAAYLRDKLADISESERIIPDFKLTEWEVE